jgi:hypothetical protein
MKKTVLFHNQDFSTQITTWSEDGNICVMIKEPKHNTNIPIMLDPETAQAFIDEMQERLNLMISEGQTNE